MKDYIKQFYSEGFATTFYLRPVNFLKKTIKNKQLCSILIKMAKILYTIAALLLAFCILYYKLF